MLRLALIGLGSRGLRTLQRYIGYDDVEIAVLCDVNAEAVATAQDLLRRAGRPVASVWESPYDDGNQYKTFCDGLIYICTPWESHTPLAVAAMRAGCDVAVEVPAATTLEECQLLLDTTRATGKRLFMTENCCYDRFHLSALEMVRSGMLGNITHLEGAYYHTLPQEGWMAQQMAAHGGNPYPTHAFGPVCQLLRAASPTDRFVSLTSVSSSASNHTLLRSQEGRTALIGFDVSTPRPYSRLQTLCGTEGFLQKYPLPTVFLHDTCRQGAEAEQFLYENYACSPAARTWLEGHAHGVENEMNYVMDRRLIHALQQGAPLDLTPEDAALWSVLAPLTAQSAQQGGATIEIPDFSVR